MTDTTGTPALDKTAVVRWLRRTADSYARDAGALERDGDPELAALVPRFRSFSDFLRDEAYKFDAHGPLPVLDPRVRSHEISGAARCPDYPEGCGERARYAAPTGRASEVVIYHRDGCAVLAALRADADADVTGWDLSRG